MIRRPIYSEHLMDSVAWLTKLISFQSVSHLSNLPLIEAIENCLRDHQIRYDRLNHPTEPKANLLASIPDREGNYQGGLLFSGHTDVVPVAGQHWESDPFNAVVTDTKVIGRGSCDMKGFLAVLLALMPFMKAQSLQFPLHFAFSYDEEVGCVGAISLIEHLQRLIKGIAVCIVGEPTEMKPVIGHKGMHIYRCKLQGKAAHSSLTPEGVNAIDYAAQFARFLRSMADDYRDQGPYDDQFDVPYTTLSTNQIQGGIAQNIIPAACQLTFEFRHLPSHPAAVMVNRIEKFLNKELMPALQAESVDARVDLELIASAPSFASSIKQLEGVDLKHASKVAFVTEAGLFEQAGIPSLVCGPGSINQAHRANEFVLISQLRACELFIKNLIQLGI